MDNEDRPVKEGAAPPGGFVGEEKSLEGFTKEEPITIEPKGFIETEEEVTMPQPHPL